MKEETVITLVTILVTVWFVSFLVGIIGIWRANRRYRERQQQIEDEYLKIRNLLTPPN